MHADAEGALYRVEGLSVVDPDSHLLTLTATLVPHLETCVLKMDHGAIKSNQEGVLTARSRVTALSSLLSEFDVWLSAAALRVDRSAPVVILSVTDDETGEGVRRVSLTPSAGNTAPRLTEGLDIRGQEDTGKGFGGRVGEWVGVNR
jgi:hypothetical protein